MSISYAEAWGLWFSGQQPPSDAVLWGVMSLRWWARAGKIAAFFGGATVVLDLLGAERLRRLGRTDWVPVLAFGILGLGLAFAVVYGEVILEKSDVHLAVRILVGILSVAVVPFGLMAVGYVAETAIGGLFKKTFDTTLPGHSLRILGVGLVFAGFHFDLLAS